MSYLDSFFVIIYKVTYKANMDNTEVKTLKTAVYTRRAVDKYQAANKNKIKEYKAAYYQKNKERLSALARE